MARIHFGSSCELEPKWMRSFRDPYRIGFARLCRYRSLHNGAASWCSKTLTCGVSLSLAKPRRRMASWTSPPCYWVCLPPLWNPFHVPLVAEYIRKLNLSHGSQPVTQQPLTPMDSTFFDIGLHGALSDVALPLDGSPMLSTTSEPSQAKFQFDIDKEYDCDFTLSSVAVAPLAKSQSLPSLPSSEADTPLDQSKSLPCLTSSEANTPLDHPVSIGGSRWHHLSRALHVRKTLSLTNLTRTEANTPSERPVSISKIPSRSNTPLVGSRWLHLARALLVRKIQSLTSVASTDANTPLERPVSISKTASRSNTPLELPVSICSRWLHFTRALHVRKILCSAEPKNICAPSLLRWFLFGWRLLWASQKSLLPSTSLPSTIAKATVQSAGLPRGSPMLSSTSLPSTIAKATAQSAGLPRGSPMLSPTNTAKTIAQSVGLPRGSPMLSATSSPSSMAQLVLAVKNLQRNGLQLQWTSYIHSLGRVALDPSRHSPEVLEKFISSHSKAPADLKEQSKGGQTTGKKNDMKREKGGASAAIAHAKTIIWTRIDSMGNQTAVDFDGNVFPTQQPCDVSQELFLSSVQSGVGASFCKLDMMLEQEQ